MKNLITINSENNEVNVNVKGFDLKYQGLNKKDVINFLKAYFFKEKDVEYSENVEDIEKPSEKKYKFTGETTRYKDKVLHRIIALKDFKGVNKGDLGGWIEKEENLSHEGNCWATTDSKIMDDARVTGNAFIRTGSMVCGNASIDGDADIIHSSVCENAKIGERAIILGSTIVGKVKIYGRAVMYEQTIGGDIILY